MVKKKDPKAPAKEPVTPTDNEEELEAEEQGEAEEEMFSGVKDERYENFVPGKDEEKRNVRGWKRDKPDHRDIFFKDALNLPERFAALPGNFSLRTVSPPVYDQGSEGSCTAFSCDSTVTTDQMRQNLESFELSHNFTYYNTRTLEGTTNRDSGASCRDVLKAYSKFGFARASTYPYNTRQVLAKPPQGAYDEGLKNIVKPTQYARVNQTLDELKTAISMGLPVFLGMDVFRQLQSSQARQTGVLTMPSRRERPIGGHAVTLVGWDDAKQMFEWRNSWGPKWGDQGYGWMPYAMALSTQITGDCWVLRTLTDVPVGQGADDGDQDDDSDDNDEEAA